MTLLRLQSAIDRLATDEILVNEVRDDFVRIVAREYSLNRLEVGADEDGLLTLVKMEPVALVSNFFGRIAFTDGTLNPKISCLDTPWFNTLLYLVLVYTAHCQRFWSAVLASRASGLDTKTRLAEENTGRRALGETVAVVSKHLCELEVGEKDDLALIVQELNLMQCFAAQDVEIKYTKGVGLCWEMK
jgi:hypothetical protein